MNLKKQPRQWFGQPVKNMFVLIPLLFCGLAAWFQFGFSPGQAGPPNTQTGPSFNYELAGRTVILKLESYNGLPGRLPTAIRFEVRARIAATLADCLRSQEFGGGLVGYFQTTVRTGSVELIHLEPGPEFVGNIPCFDISFVKEDGSTGRSLQIAPRVLEAENEETLIYPSTSPQLATADLPAEFTLDEALAIFKNQLTAEGLKALAGVSFKIHANGCEGPRYESTPVAGCWKSRYNTIYIDNSYFPAYYAEWEDQTKLEHIKRTVHVLIHEAFHALDTQATAAGHDDLIGAVFNCHIKNPEFSDGSSGSTGSTEGAADKQKRRVARTPWDRIGSAAEECLHKHPFWGAITAAIKQAYLEKMLSTELDLERWGFGGEIFSTQWYLEYYAELPAYDVELPLVLENHYGRYLKDRRGYADALNDPDSFFGHY